MSTPTRRLLLLLAFGVALTGCTTPPPVDARASAAPPPPAERATAGRNELACRRELRVPNPLIACIAPCCDKPVEQYVTCLATKPKS